MSENDKKEREPFNYNYLSGLIFNQYPPTPSSPPPTLSQMREMNKNRDKYLEQYNFSYCEDANKYLLTAKIGQGTFG